VPRERRREFTDLQSVFESYLGSEPLLIEVP
jgi:hypothetical protein